MNIWLPIHVAGEVLLFASPSNGALMRLSLKYQVHLNAEEWKDRTLSQWQNIFISQKKTTTQHAKKVYCAEESVFTIPTRSESFFQRTDAHFKVKILNQRVLPSKLSHNISSGDQGFFFFFFTWLQLVSPPKMFACGCDRGLLAFRKAEWAQKRVLPSQPDRVHLLFLTTPLTFFFLPLTARGGGVGGLAFELSHAKVII